MSKRPLPSKILFIKQLLSRNTGEKVRFLGCVNKYNIASCTLEVFHDYPQEYPDLPPTAIVNLEHVIETTSKANLETGSWVNVVGYITSDSDTTTKSHSRAPQKPPSIQAVMLWPAGTIDLATYETAVFERQQGF